MGTKRIVEQCASIITVLGGFPQICSKAGTMRTALKQGKGLKMSSLECMKRGVLKFTLFHSVLSQGALCFYKSLFGHRLSLPSQHLRLTRAGLQTPGISISKLSPMRLCLCFSDVILGSKLLRAMPEIRKRCSLKTEAPEEYLTQDT